MASASTLAPHSPFLSRLPPHKPLANLNSTKTRFPKFSLLASVSSSQSFEEREEERWLREEQRWLREEQRWLRVEERWKQEREKLLDEIVRLRMQIEMTEKGKKLSKFDVEVVRGEITERADVKEMVFEEFVKVEDVIVKEVKEEKRENKEKEREKKKKKKSERRALRVGSEGDDVKAMQEALQKLGFYSGEEDMEFSSFSSGTLRAVKTWQASLGTAETGIMTDELLAILFLDNEITDSPSKSTPESVNGGTIASVAKIEEKIIKENDDDSNSEVSKYSGSGVFLLGENRWEEPSRLIKNKNNNNLNTKNITKCLTCRGEGRLMCTECDGTGEPNIEPQFMEWVDEGMKCPYCDGLGYTICDVCQGITPLQN